MGFFNSLFNSDKPDERPDGLPENRVLLADIDAWYKKPNDDTYKKVVLELMEGNPVLLLPSANKINNQTEWQTLAADTTVNLTSVVVVDGLKVLGAFTDEQALLNWAGKPTIYTAMHSNDVLVLCEKNGISRVVINSDSYNMFVLERSRKEVKPNPIPPGATVKVGTAERTLPKPIIDKLTAGFDKNQFVEEAYQYNNEYNGEASLVIGVTLSSYTNESKAAATFLVQDAIRGEDLEQPLDIFFLEDLNWLQTIKQIPGSKFYSK